MKTIAKVVEEYHKLCKNCKFESKSNILQRCEIEMLLYEICPTYKCKWYKFWIKDK